jgi:hypothetical protein
MTLLSNGTLSGNSVDDDDLLLFFQKQNLTYRHIPVWARYSPEYSFWNLDGNGNHFDVDTDMDFANVGSE